MIARGFAIGRDARALRFLLLCGGGWTILRVAAHWSPAVPPPPELVPPRWSVPFAVAATALPSSDVPPAAAAGERRMVSGQGASPMAIASGPDGMAATAPSALSASGDGWSTDRHGLRAALLAQRLPEIASGAQRSAMLRGGAEWLPLAPTQRAEPGRGRPFWMRRQMAGWSLGGWVYLRDGDSRSRGGIAAASQLGGSQAGSRLAYGFGETGRARAYGRVTLAVRRPEQRELALGLAFAPVAHLPIDLAVEHRIAIGREGRTALAAMVSGGVGDVALPHGFRLEAYGQAGVVGARRRDGFADAAIVVDRRLGPDETSPLRIGALAAGAVQPGAARVDVGPRLTFRLPDVGQGSRIALDWRQRVAGDARPESGAALTLATDF